MIICQMCLIWPEINRPRRGATPTDGQEHRVARASDTIHNTGDRL